jgi:integrase
VARRRGRGEGSRFTRERDGRKLYIGRVQVDGARHQVASRDARERDRLLRALIRDLEAGNAPASVPRRMVLRQVVAVWLADRELTRPATYPTWKSYARHLLDCPLAGVRVGALTPAAVTAFYRERLGAGYAPSTVRQIHRTLQACLNWAVGQEVPVPAPVLKMQAPAVAVVERVQLTPAQVGRLFRSLRERDDPLEALWRLVYYTAARLGEGLALPWINVDLGAGEIWLTRILVKSVGGEPRTRPGKSKGSQAVLAIPPDAVDALRRHWLRQEERRALLGAAWMEQRAGRLVVDRGDGGSLRHEQAEQAFYQALEAAGLPRCRPHDLRGAALSALREAGHDVLDVQRRARHASVQTTLESYVRASDAADRRAAETLERLVHDSSS